MQFSPRFFASIVVLLALNLAGCGPTGVLNALAESETSRRVIGVAYGPDPRQRLDVYVPRNGPGPHPVVLFFFGGSWNSGDRGDYRFVGEALAARGNLVVIADYRLYPQVRYPAFLEDAAGAARWTIDNLPAYGGDPKRLYVMGHSAGAYNAAMLALDSRWLLQVGASPKVFAGFIGLAGPYDFLPIDVPEVKPVFFYPNSPADSQPIIYATAKSPRAFLGAPETDNLVDPERNTHQLAQKLSANGVPVVYKRYSRVNHVTLIATLSRPLRWLAPVLDDIVTFIAADGRS